MVAAERKVWVGLIKCSLIPLTDMTLTHSALVFIHPLPHGHTSPGSALGIQPDPQDKPTHTSVPFLPNPSSLGASLQRHCQLMHQAPSTTTKSVQVRLGLWRVAGGDRFSSPACHFPSRPEAPGEQVSAVVISRTAVFLGPHVVQHK